MNGVTSSLSSFHSSFSPFPSSPLLSSFPSSSLLSLEVVGSALSYLEQRQDWVLNQISQLQERVKNLGDTLGVSPAEVGVLPQAAAAPEGVAPDVVISCPPSDPPYPLLSLCHRLATRGVPLACSVHVHSSVAGQVSSQLMEFWKSIPQSHDPALRITLLWKSPSSCPQPTMVVSPHNQTPVRGIANIARYVCRLFCPELYEGQGHQQSALVDSWLDAVTGMYIFGSSKEKLSVLRRLNSHLGSCQFLAGDDVTLADVVAYAIICGGPGGQKLTDNVRKWINCCQSRPEFQGVPTVNLTSS
jgi:hypothetical protein